MYKRDEMGIKLMEIKKFNDEFHDRQFQRWDEGEIKFLIDNFNTSYVELSICLGRSADAIYRKKKRLNLLNR